jgi:hypothetical protein
MSIFITIVLIVFVAVPLFFWSIQIGKSHLVRRQITHRDANWRWSQDFHTNLLLQSLTDWFNYQTSQDRHQITDLFWMGEVSGINQSSQDDHSIPDHPWEL